MYSSSVIDSRLLDLIVDCQRVFWAGQHPPLGRMACSDDIYSADCDFRVPAHFHGTFEAVVLLEKDLGHFKQWPAILDEALRLVGPGGTLVLRFTSTPLMTVYELKFRIHAWTKGRVEVVSEHSHEAGTTVSTFRLLLAEKPRPMLDTFSFGMISDGRKPDAVRAFVHSVRALRGLDQCRYEILLCAPQSQQEFVEALGDDVRLVVDTGEFAERGWITRKKNRIVQAALFENLLVAHDRYTLAPDFLDALKRFGADFSVLVCRQETADGVRHPDWVTLGSAWSGTTPAMLPYDEYCRYIYINGGLMLAKRRILEDVGWNDLLFWMQAEDVELTRRLTANGVIPRLARNVLAISAAPRRLYNEDFESLPKHSDGYLLTHLSQATGERLAPTFRLGCTVSFGADSASDALEHGVRLGQEWRLEPFGAIWDGVGHAEITVRLNATVEHPLELLLGVEISSPGSPPAVFIDGMPLATWTDSGGFLRAATDFAWWERPVVRVRLSHPAGTGPALRLREFGLVVSAFAAQVDLSFCSGGNGVHLLEMGWAPPESWGVWNVSSESRVLISPPSETVPHPSCKFGLEVEAMAYAPVAGDDCVVGLSANGIPFGHFTLPGNGQSCQREVQIPASLMSELSPTCLGFHPKGRLCPSKLGLNPDSRFLGLGLIRMKVKSWL